MVILKWRINLLEEINWNNWINYWFKINLLKIRKCFVIIINSLISRKWSNIKEMYLISEWNVRIKVNRNNILINLRLII